MPPSVAKIASAPTPYPHPFRLEVFPLKILLTNDDGIHAPGLWAAAQVGQVCISVPDREQSGVGAALTLTHPIRAQSVSPAAYCQDLTSASNPVTAHIVEGTPGDSCVLALEQLVGKVDLVVSGINRGSNLGWDIMVSGTVGAALQGYVRGCPTIAISVGSVQDPKFDAAARFLELTVARLRTAPLDQPFFLNVNVPSLAPEQVSGVQVTRLAGRSYNESVRAEGLMGQQRYWISRNRPVQAGNVEGTDTRAMQNNRISITPLHLDLSNADEMPRIESLLSGIQEQFLGRED